MITNCMKVKYLHFLFLSFCFFVAVIVGAKLIFTLKPVPEFSPISDITLIAHAGGGLPQGSYSNSREAFDLASSNGFVLFETDLSWTQNQELVLIHDWREKHYKFFSICAACPSILTKILPRKRAKTVESFHRRKMNNNLHQMSLPSLIQWLKKTSKCLYHH